MNESAQNKPPPPPSPENFITEWYDPPGGIGIRLRRARGAQQGAVSLLFFICAVAWIILLFLAVQKSAPEWLAAAIPAFIFWLFVAGILAWMKFGEEVLILRPREAIFQRRVLGLRLSSRAVPRIEIRSFRECVRENTETDETYHGIEMLTDGKPLQFFFHLPDAERAYHIYDLNRYITPLDPSEQL